MNRSRFFVISFGVFTLMIVAVLATRSFVRADLSERTASQIYQPDFADWAFLYLNACYRDHSGQTHFVSVGRETVNGRLRFKILGSYAKSPLGQAWFDGIGSKIRSAIESDCKRWTAEGFPIGLNDFQIEITQSPDKPK